MTTTTPSRLDPDITAALDSASKEVVYEPVENPVNPNRSKAATKTQARLREKREAEEKAAARRAKPVDPRTKGVFATALTMAAAILLSAGLFSFASIAAAAEWMQPEWPWLVWVVPFFLEFFIVFFGIDAVISQANGDKKGANWALAWMFVFSGVAVIGNAAHTIDGWGEAALTDWRAWVGTGLAALAPLSVVLIVKRTSRLVFVRSEG
jgi:hypothetical protein